MFIKQQDHGKRINLSNQHQEESSSCYNSKAFWRSYKVLTIQSWTVKAIGWEIEYLNSTFGLIKTIKA